MVCDLVGFVWLLLILFCCCFGLVGWLAFFEVFVLASVSCVSYGFLFGSSTPSPSLYLLVLFSARFPRC